MDELRIELDILIADSLYDSIVLSRYNLLKTKSDFQPPIFMTSASGMLAIVLAYEAKYERRSWNLK